MLTFGWAILNRWLKSLKLTVFQFFLLFCCQASFAVSQQPIYNTTYDFFRQVFFITFFNFFWKFFLGSFSAHYYVKLARIYRCQLLHLFYSQLLAYSQSPQNKPNKIYANTIYWKSPHE